MPRIIRFAAPVALAAFLAVGFAGTASAEQTCHITGKMMTKEAITKSLHARGYTKVRGLSRHNGCWEAKGLDSKGRRFELELNGATGAIQNRE